MWMCTHCRKSFASSRALKIHEVKQHETAARHMLKCGTCHEEFEHTNLLHIHMRVHHDIKVRCPRCKDIFEHPNVLKLHIKAHHSEPVCVTCGVTFDHDKLLRLHMEHYHRVGHKGTTQSEDKQFEDKQSEDKQSGKVQPEADSEMNALPESQAAPTLASDSRAKSDGVENKVQITLLSEQPNGLITGNAGIESRHQSSKGGTTRESSNGYIVERTPALEENVVDNEGPVIEEESQEFEGKSYTRFCDGSDLEHKNVDSDGGENGAVVRRRNFLSLSNDGQQNQCGESDILASVVKDDTISTEETSVVANSEFVSLPFDYGRDPAQLQRSSVIVTTGNIPAVIMPQATVQKEANDLENVSRGSAAQLSPGRSANLSDTDVSPKGSPQSYTSTISSTLSGDESGDSEQINQSAHLSKRSSLRCNRCKIEFLSKMEYLHHLISHQDGDQSERSPEGNVEDQAIMTWKWNVFRNEMAMSRNRESATSQNNSSFQESYFPVGEKRASTEVDRVPRSGLNFDEAAQRNLPNVKESTRGFSIVCSICKELFTDWRRHKLHVEKCHKKPHCAECGLGFDHKNLFNIHMSSYHSSKEVLQCYYCDESFDYRSEFLSHVTSHEPKRASTEETRRDPNSLRRVRSAIDERDIDEQNLSKRLRSSLTAGGGRDSNQSDVSALLLSQRFEERQTPMKENGPCVEESSPSLIALECPQDNDCHRQRRSECDEGEGSHVNGGRGARTRIFLPKPPDNRNHHSPWAERVFLSTEKRNHDSTDKVSRRFSEDYAVTAFSRYERTENLSELSKSLLQGYNHITRSDQANKAFVGPPPLIPVVHPRAANAETNPTDIHSRKKSLFLRGHQPVTRTFSANSALRSHRSSYVPSRFSEHERTAHSLSRTGLGREGGRMVPTPESINNITKEALLNSLSLRRRASAPELGALARRFNEIQGNPGRSFPLQVARGAENPKSPLASSSVALQSGRACKVNEAYQPRRRHPRDFTCHHCGIYFGHKKLLKIHLDCYHGSSQELQCLPCKKSFTNRSDFLEHLMSHKDNEKVMVIPGKNVPQGEKVVHEGETLIHRELNRTPILENPGTREVPDQRKPAMGGIREESGSSFPDETSTDVDKHRFHAVVVKEEICNEAGTKANSGTTAQSIVERNEDGDGANFCFVCGKAFKSGKQLEQHISSHAVVDKNGRYCCSLCNKTFDHHRKLEIHSRSHTGFKPHKCELCGRSFPYYSSYYYHKMTHTEDRPHKCTVCGKGFIQTRYLRSHMKTHKDQTDSASDAVQSNPNNSDEMAVSQLRELGTKIKSEPVDPLESSAPKDLEEHTTARILCSFKQSTNAGMSEIQSRMGVEPFGDCLKNSGNEKRSDLSSEAASLDDILLYPRRAQQLEHSRENSSSVDGVLNSRETPVGMLSRIENEQGVSSHTEGIPKFKKKTYQCKYCHKNFSSYSSLHVHVRIHTGQRPYSCNHCFKKFTHSSGLKRHVRCHTGEKPYPCPACPAAFADRGALKSHIRTHTGERPFICDLCKKTFTQPSSLRVHKKTVHAHEFFDDK